ncbi:hypothetical protein BV898_00450 [Hypsibius exemplaris]|uniref:G-protein coupled receptors family 1 profile domain-containing protein n=1 Tax=Hypsibius exemplaris TaxID=2072580 RepID=A0A1W0XDJ1_HYPEX|nr:hypothetical protein BV898_00450 [Hypsibius exemplaris]
MNNGSLVPIMNRSIDALFTANLTAQEAPIDPVLICWKVLTGIFCLFGALSNVFVLIVLIKSPTLRRGAGLLIAHLLTCHVFMCSIGQPVYIHFVWAHASNNPNPDNSNFCPYYAPFLVTIGILVNWSEAALAFNRFVAVFFPTKYVVLNRTIVHYSVLFVCWSCTLAVSLPPALGAFGSYELTSLGTCGVHYTLSTSVAFGLTFLNSYVPLIILTAGTVIILAKFTATHFGQSTAIIRPQLEQNAAGPPAARTSERRKRASRMLLASFVLSLACQFPLNVVVLTGTQFRFPKETLWIRTLSTLEFAITPILFLTMNRDYHDKALALIRQWTCVQPSGQPPLVLLTGKSQSPSNLIYEG